MSERPSIRRVYRSRSVLHWVVLASSFAVLLALMYLFAYVNTRPTVAPVTDPDNDFVPGARDISDCISALPKPGCGSEARGGWRQGIVLLAILTGLAFIVWRIVRSARRARPDASNEGSDPRQNDRPSSARP